MLDFPRYPLKADKRSAVAKAFQSLDDQSIIAESPCVGHGQRLDIGPEAPHTSRATWDWPRQSRARDRELHNRRKHLNLMLVATGDKDADAFHTLYELTAAKLFGICLRICGERRAAEDVLQEVYLTIWKYAGSYDPNRSAPITWLATIARNRAIDWQRANCATQSLPLEAAASISEPGLSAPDAMLVVEKQRQLRCCLDKLDEMQRSVILAAFHDGLTYAEQARQRRVPLGTLKSRVRRGLIRLKECLGDHP